MGEKAIDPRVRIGHVHLKVANLQRALEFCCGVLGFELIQRHGEEAAFVSAGGYHHRIGLNTWKSRDGSPPPKGTTGLYHFAILYPTRAALADGLMTPEAGEHSSCRGKRSWCERTVIPERSGWERNRALLGSPTRIMAAARKRAD